MCMCVYVSWCACESFCIPVYVCIPVHMEIFIGKCAQSVCQWACMCCLRCVYFMHLWVFMDRPICLYTSVNVYVCVALHPYVLESLCSCIRVYLCVFDQYVWECLQASVCLSTPVYRSMFVCVHVCVSIYRHLRGCGVSGTKTTKRNKGPGVLSF